VARLLTIGFEIGVVSGAGNNQADGAGSSIGSIDSTVKRSGASSLKIAGTAATGGMAGPQSVSVADGVTLYGRAFHCFDALPSASPASTIARWQIGASALVGAALTPSGKLRLYDLVTSTQIGSDSAATIAADGVTWYRIELSVTFSAAGNESYELQLDGVTVASGSSALTSTTTGWVYSIGFGAAPGNTCNQWIDDYAINDSTGTDQNSWCGDGKVVLCVPTGGTQSGSWTGGAGGTTNLWDAVNNTPPIGTASETDLTQIESVDSSGDNTTDEYRAVLTTYADAGVGASDTITVVQALVDHGEDVATGTKTGKFGLQANPAHPSGGGQDSFTFGDDVGALGTWPSNWRTKWGTPLYNPSTAHTSTPVLAVRKTDTGTRVASADFLGLYVEYVPAAPSGPFPPFPWQRLTGAPMYAR